MMASKHQKGLDPQAATLLKAMKSMKMSEPETLTLKARRELQRTAAKAVMGKLEKVSKVEDLRIPGPTRQIPIRVYTPHGKGPFPILVYFHGGGFVVGSVQETDNICRAVANKVSCVAVSVEYPLASEHKYPAAVNDSYAATKWVSENADKINGDPTRIAVGGDSAGGNLAAVVSLKARDENAKFPIYQILICPATDLSGLNTASWKQFSNDYTPTKDDMLWYMEQYFERHQDRHVPYASPLLATDFRKLPPALIITAEFDPVRDEGEAYGEKLRKSGVSVKVSRYEGMIHDFATMDRVINKAKDAWNEIVMSLKDAFQKGSQEKARPGVRLTS
jgi:acetyl esterase